MTSNDSCFNCGSKGEELYEYIVCEDCKSKFKLFTDFKILNYVAEYDEDEDHTFKEEMEYRLDFIHKEYIKKRIKLLHILDRLKYLT